MSFGFLRIANASKWQRQLLVLVGATFSVIACASSPRQTPEPAVPAPVSAQASTTARTGVANDSALVMPPLSQFTRMGTGLMYYDVAIGTGTAAVDLREVEVHYSGYLENGQQFDNSRTRGSPIKFVLGQGKVIPGWDQGMRGMRIGGQRILVIPPALAYGATGNEPVIPKNATLIFVVTLVSVR